MLFLLACAWTMEVENPADTELVSARIYRANELACDDLLEAPIPPGGTGRVLVPMPKGSYVNAEWTWGDGTCVIHPYFTLADAYRLTDGDRQGEGCACE